MLLELLGILLSSIAASVWLLYKYTGDVYPRALKKLLLKTILKNWQSSLPQRLGKYSTLKPQDAEDSGIFPNKEDIALEEPIELLNEGATDDLIFYGVDNNGNGLVARVRRHYGDVAEGEVYVNLNGGSSYSASTHGKSVRDFAVGTVKLELVEAMRSWRLWFNGIATGTNGSEVHLTVHGLWKPLGEPGDIQRDSNVNLIAEDLSNTGEFGHNLLNFQKKLPKGYSQFGATHLWVQVDEQPKEELYLYGFRVRKQLHSEEHSSQNAFELFGMSGEDGNAFRLAAHDSLWTHGDIQHVSGAVHPLTSITASASSFKVNNKAMPKFFSISGTTGTCNLEIYKEIAAVSMTTSDIVIFSMRSNGLKSNGILVRHKPVEAKVGVGRFAGQNRDILAEEKVTELDFVSLQSNACLDVKLVGGKGASLANLERLVRERKLTDEYKTASGFCVTTVFFNRILDTEKITRIFAAATNDTELSEACTQVQNLILHSNLEDTIAPLVSLWMNKAFVQVEKGKFSQMTADRFAVRSSGVLEDGADMSAAGQNETYLGVKEEQVSLKVLACWASLFTFQSVRYRLNHGQPAVSEMGVVVQAMVNAQAAGVMFTADPITGNPFEILINANYGLGESVVSAICDPDTVKVQRSKDFPGKLQVTSRIVGQKISKVIMSDTSLGLTQEVPISDQEAETCCIDDATAVKLASFGLTLMEANDGKPVDVEWAVTANEVYILQSRNITSLDLWTDEEIIHEFDAGLRTQFERLTTANVGEVTPGACSPLGLSTVMKILDNALQVKMCDRSGFQPMPSSNQILAFARHRLLLNVVQIMYRNMEAEIQPAFVAVDLAVFGHRVIDEELHRIAVARWGIQSGRQKLYAFAFILKLIAQSGKIITEATNLLSKYTFPLSAVQNDPVALYNKILEELPVLQKATSYHCSMSDASSGMQIFTTLFVSEGKNPEEWDSKIFNDVAKMLSVSTDVESADIPTAIDKLATTVAQYCKQREVAMPTDTVNALDWLQSTPELHEAYNEFMAKHGHRCIFELDLMRQSWQTEPTQFVKLLQSIVQSKSKHQKEMEAVEKRGFENDTELIESLENPTKNMTKRILKFILPYCRSTVWNREKSKSLLVWVGNEFKKAFNRLGQLLSEKRLLPDAQLIYFLTLDEVRQIVEMRDTSARILSKAMRRRKLHPALDKEEFPEIMVGIPRPIEINADIELGDSIKGTPVSSGKVRGVVKVCLTVEDATELIQPGDIMLARSTDIAWSPLFPILGGVVTELGGLISHGAVVAREYGLPCIVGATGATRVFKTGETVLLDATNGIMSKVPA